jgi:hypothetical protein
MMHCFAPTKEISTVVWMRHIIGTVILNVRVYAFSDGLASLLFAVSLRSLLAPFFLHVYPREKVSTGEELALLSRVARVNPWLCQ